MILSWPADVSTSLYGTNPVHCLKVNLFVFIGNFFKCRLSFGLILPEIILQKMGVQRRGIC